MSEPVCRHRRCRIWRFFRVLETGGVVLLDEQWPVCLRSARCNLSIGGGHGNDKGRENALIAGVRHCGIFEPQVDKGRWSKIGCEEREALVSRNGAPYDGLSVALSRTDIDGQYGEPCIFTEWYDRATDQSVLRDYRYPAIQHEGEPHQPDVKPCEHYERIAAPTPVLAPLVVRREVEGGAL